MKTDAEIPVGSLWFVSNRLFIVTKIACVHRNERFSVYNNGRFDKYCCSSNLASIILNFDYKRLA